MMRRMLILLGLLLPAIAGAAVQYTPGPVKLQRAGVFQANYPDWASCDAALRAQPVTSGQVKFRCIQDTVAKFVANPPAPVDCVVSAWGAWVPGAWSACAGGSQSRQETRTRQIVVAPSGGGAACPPLTETQTVTQSCGGGGSNEVVPAIYPLELIQPRAAGSVPVSGAPAMPAGHRFFKAYPGLEYNIRAAVIGGSYPFSYALSNAPSGMTIDPKTGEINWPDPQSNANPTITVTDAQGAQQSSSWSITVGTAGFVFMDAVNGSDTSAGTIGSPWKTLNKLQQSGTVANIVYFKSGTYRVEDASVKTPGGTNPWSNAAFAAVRWIEYPGSNAVIDHGYQPGRVGWNIRLQDQAVYVDGLTTRNYGNIGWQPVGHYETWRNLTAVGPVAGIDGGNPGTVMFIDEGTGGYIAHYAVFQDNDFSGSVGGGHLKTYTLKKLLVEDNLFHDTQQGFDIKQDVQRWEARGNKFVNVGESGISGNFAQRSVPGGTNNGEVRYNLFNMPNASTGAIYTGGPPIYIYRNTFVAKVLNTMSAGETIHMFANVLVNSLAPPTKSYNAWFVSSQPTWDLDGPNASGGNTNLAGNPGDGVVDANGLLLGPYRTSHLGKAGYEIP